MTLPSTTWGSGAPLVLLHGFTGAGSAFDHLREVLGARFRVTAPDLPGHGNGPEATGWDDAVEELFATPHGLDLAHAAALCGARLSRPHTAAELRACVREGLGNGLQMVEVRTERTANVEKHRELQRIVAAALEAP